MFGSEGNEHKAQGANWQKSILFRCLKSEKISHPKIRKIEIIFPFLWEPLATNRPHFQFFVSAATCERAFTTAFKSHISCKKDLFDANGKSIKKILLQLPESILCPLNEKKTFSCIFLTITVRCTRRRAWLEMLDCIKELFLGPWTLSYCWVPRHQHLGHEDAVSCTLAIKSKTIENNADLIRNC